MSLTNRKAPEDTVINREALTEGLDVRGPGRYYPEEFSSQLQIAQHQGSVLSEIPKALAGIIVQYDDYKISSWHDEEQTNINRERIEADNDIRFKENAAQVEAGVEIYDTQKQMQSELNTAMEQADINGTKREDAALEVLSKYENPDQFIDRPALQQMWGNTYHNNALNTLNRAQNEDIKTIHAKREAALSDLISTGYAEVIAGRENPEQALNRMMPQIVNLTKDLPAVDVQKYMNAAWNELVLAKAQLIYEQVSKGAISAEKGMLALRQLAADYTQKDFICVDEKHNILKNKDGSDKKFTLTLTPDTQNKLYNVFREASGSGSGSSNDGQSLTDWENDFNDAVGWKEFTETGTSSKIIGWSFNQFNSFIAQQRDFIMNGKGSDSAKQNKLNKLCEKAGQLAAFINIADQVKAGNTDIKKYLPDIINKLSADINNPNTEWSTYKLQLPKTINAEGKEIDGLILATAGYNDKSPRLGNDATAKKLYWQSALNQFRKLSTLINNGSSGEIFSKIDLTCNTAISTLDNLIEAGTLTKGTGYTTSTSVEGSTKIEQALKQFDNGTLSYGIPYAQVPYASLDKLINSINDTSKFPTAIQRFKGMQTIITGFKKAGHISDLVQYAMINKDKINTNNIASNFMLALCLHETNDKKLQNIAADILTNMGPEKEKKLQEYAKEAGYTSAMLSNLEDEVYNELHIPKNHRESDMYAGVTKFCEYVAAHEKKNVTYDIAYKGTLKKLLQANYVNLDKSTRIQSAIFKHSPQMRIFQGDAGAKKLEQTLHETNRRLDMALNGLPRSYTIYSDDEAGIFRYVKNGRNMGKFGGSYVGSLYFSDAMKNLSPQNIGIINAVRVASAIIATDKNTRINLAKGSTLFIDKKDFSKYNLVGKRFQFAPTYSNTLYKIYNADKSDRMDKDAIIIAAAMHNPQKLDNLAIKMGKASTPKGALQDVRSTMPKPLWLRVFLDFNHGFASDTSKYKQDLLMNPKYRAGKFMSEGMATGYASDITNDVDNINMILADTESATKVRQADVSVPIALAAVGNEEYIDMYNASELNGDAITGVELPGVFTDNDAADKGYLGELPDIQYDTHLTRKEKQEFNNWVSQQKEEGNILPEDNFEDYDMQGFWKNEVLNNTEYATATAETHFPDKYKKPNHPTFSNESIYYNEETANQAGHWEGDTFVSSDGQATGYAADINNLYTGTLKACPNTTTRKYTKNEISQLIDYYANLFEIPLPLAHAVVRQESGGQQYVISKDGAVGIMQLMPKTAKSLGVKDSTDAAQNIWGGMKYLAENYKQYGFWSLALAAYNAGPGAVNAARGIPNNSETRNYVKNIFKMAGMSEDLSSFPVRYSFDHPKNKKYIDKDTGLLSPTQLNNFLYVMNNTTGFKDKVVQIKVNRPELLEDKPEYADFKKYREMKNSKGEPLFAKGTYNGFQVMVKTNNSNNGIINPTALEAVAEDAYNNQTTTLNPTSKENVQAMLNTFSGRYNNQMLSEYTPSKIGPQPFGLANLTSQEYQDYGVPLYAQQNPIMQARVLATEFQRANDILGSERKAIYALAGGKLTDENGSIKSWVEIKKDTENFMKQWFIKPSSDEKERNQINAIVAMYNSESNRLRRFD